MGRGPKKGITSPLERVYREIAVLKKVGKDEWVGAVELGMMSKKKKNKENIK